MIAKPITAEQLRFRRLSTMVNLQRWSRLASLLFTFHPLVIREVAAFKDVVLRESTLKNSRRRKTRVNHRPIVLPRGGSAGLEFQDVRASAARQAAEASSSSLDRILLWTIPLFGALFSFGTFKFMSSVFHEVVQWASSNTWFPATTEEVTLQTNVVTQVVNGPVITSISVLFATLVSMTVSNLYARQVDIQASLVQEVQAIRRLQHLLTSETAVLLLNEMERSRLEYQFQKHKEQLMVEHHHRSTNDGMPEPYKYIESNLLNILDWINEKLSEQMSFPSTDFFLSQVQGLTLRVLQERSNRWLAMKALHFPMVHYVTLSLLALSIGVAFLVATDGAEFIFLHGLPVRILWSLLVTSFTALAVLCYDLSRPFGGAYRVVQ
jgi:Protein of unknown function (DUF4239)